MKIQRTVNQKINGEDVSMEISITLTPEEVRQIATEYEKACRIQDVWNFVDADGHRAYSIADIIQISNKMEVIDAQYKKGMEWGDSWNNAVETAVYDAIKSVETDVFKAEDFKPLIDWWEDVIGNVDSFHFDGLTVENAVDIHKKYLDEDIDELDFVKILKEYIDKE